MSEIKVLLVDDEQDFLNLMSQRIESWGYEVIPVSSGQEALNALMSQDPKAIILDYMMPEMDGVTTLKKIRKIDRKIPVIMFTAHPDNKAIGVAKKLGVSTFIPKLSTYADIQSVLKSALNIALKGKA